MPRTSKFEALARLIEERMTANLGNGPAVILFNEIPLLTTIGPKSSPRAIVRRAATLKYGRNFRTEVFGEEVRVTKL